MEKNNKRKGGAEKERDRKKKRMLEEAAKCQSLNTFFTPVKQTSSINSTAGNEVEVLSQSPSRSYATIYQNQASASTEMSMLLPQTITTPQCQVSITSDSTEENASCFEYDFFKRPSNEELTHFFSISSADSKNPK